jgi:DNA modification methylase
MSTLGDNCVNMVLVDLPYGQTKCKWDCEIDLAEMWFQLKRVCKPNSNIVFFCTTKFGYQLIKSNEKWFRYDLVWEKPKVSGFLSAKKLQLRKHEMIYVFGKPFINGKTYNPQMTIGKPYHKKENASACDLYGDHKRLPYLCKDGKRYPTSIQSVGFDREKLHRTQKPIALCEWLIKTYSNEGDVVLDFTMGSGSTGLACQNTGREFIGIEMDEQIFKIAEERLNQGEIS